MHSSTYKLTESSVQTLAMHLTLLTHSQGTDVIANTPSWDVWPSFPKPKIMGHPLRSPPRSLYVPPPELHPSWCPDLLFNSLETLVTVRVSNVKSLPLSIYTLYMDKRKQWENNKVLHARL